jgi:DNA-directed RNA polymerase alpha subunit
MNPTIKNISIEEDRYHFTLAGINVSLANSLRRVILSEIPITSIFTETYNDNNCNIEINTSRLHNEIIKQRLSCIPVHIENLDVLPGNYLLEVDVLNETDSILLITTEQFKIKNKANGNYLTKEETKRIFPPCSKTNMYIDFARLRPGCGNIIGEHLKLTAEFSVHTAGENSMFNVVSTCSYGNTIDNTKVNEVWGEYENKLRSENTTDEDIKLHKKNFYILDAQRHYINDSFDFSIQSIGIYSNKEIIKKGCKIIIGKLENFITMIDSDIVPIKQSETTMEHSFDVILENEDYTLGKIIEYCLYSKYYNGEGTLAYCGFKKFHPHDTESVIRASFKKAGDKNLLRTYLYSCCNDLKDIYEKIHKMF